MATSFVTLSKNQRLFLYFSSLTLLIFAVTPEILVDIPTAYMLKNHLHATASQVSMFRLLTGIPMYVGFAFGMARDLWDPFGWRDRGYFRLFGPLAMLVFGWLALTRLSYSGLLIGMFLAMISFRFLMAAYSGLISLIGQEELMSGRLSALWMAFRYISFIAAYFASGFITEHLSPRQTFFLAAAVTLPLCLYGFLKPRAVFSHAYDNPHARGTTFLGDLKRLAKHRAVYPAVLIILLWNFMPGFSTPMQFYLSNQVHAPDAVYANFNCIFYGALYSRRCGVRHSLYPVPAAQAVMVGGNCGSAFVDSVGLHPFGPTGSSDGGADGLDERPRTVRLLRSGHPLVPAGIAGYVDDGG